MNEMTREGLIVNYTRGGKWYKKHLIFEYEDIPADDVNNAAEDYAVEQSSWITHDNIACIIRVLNYTGTLSELEAMTDADLLNHHTRTYIVSYPLFEEMLDMKPAE